MLLISLFPIWKIGKWSLISVAKIPWHPFSIASILFVKMLSMAVAEYCVTLVGQFIKGRLLLEFNYLFKHQYQNDVVHK